MFRNTIGFMRIPFSAAAAVFLLVATSGGAFSEDVDWKQGKLGRLSPNIGTYHYDAVLDDPEVAAELLRRLGPKGVAALKARLVVQMPIAFDDGTTMVLRGLMAHEGGTEEAILSVKPHDGKIEVAILLGGKRVAASIDQFMPQYPTDAVQKQAVIWAQKAGTQVHLVGPGGR